MYHRTFPYALIMVVALFSFKFIQNKAINKGSSMKDIKLSSSSFNDHQTMDKKNVCKKAGGQDISSALSWISIDQAKSYAIIVDDPDAPSRKNPRPNPWVHWVVFDLPSTIHEIPEGASISNLGGKEGSGDSGSRGYAGPCPPQGSGPHRYMHKIYALDIESTNLSQGATKDELLKAMEGHIIGYGELVGIYEVK